MAAELATQKLAQEKTMIQLFKIAFRDLLRNKRRSFFSALALGLGLGVLLLMAAFVNGEMRGALENTLRFESGHLQVRVADYNAAKTSLAWKDLVENPTELAAKIASLPPVLAATPRLFASGIVTAGNESRGVRIIGIDPASSANEMYRQSLLRGEFLSADDRSGILIGLALAEKLNLKVGDSLTLLANTASGEIVQQPFSVRGIFSTGISGYDRATVFLPLAKAQTLVGTENHASIIFILLHDKEQAETVQSALTGSQYQAVTWREMNALLTQTEQMAGGFMVIFYLIVLGITATVITNTLIMSVFERTREIGILSAIGMKSGRILSMFLAESFLLGIGGILLGYLIGGAMVWYYTTYGFYIGNMGMTGILIQDTIYTSLNLSDAVTLSIVALIVTLLAGLYPSLLAARMEPADALRGK
ncbi:MAG: ABC transporter permease [Anaerolineae bacterium CG_4_9_14_3_um_filter_57_17]|nr:MAG: ABC transporter permease [Anaerolineae bacterium CG_4_9_14_3_um_filter_57_17]